MKNTIRWIFIISLNFVILMGLGYLVETYELWAGIFAALGVITLMVGVICFLIWAFLDD